MSDFKPITTQEELDSIIVKRLERESKKVTKEVTEKYQKELDEAKKIQGNFAKLQQELDKVTKEAGLYAKAKQDLEQTQNTLAEMTKKVRDYETQHIKTEVALKNGLDISAVDFIKGDTAEEIQASAEQLKSLVDKNANSLPMRESKPADSTEAALRGFANDLFK